ncbi:hemerythrin domain-containing protein [Streptomyces sp. NPDC058330]|uniref:hemerythrin domain-containing protein n=1 Tax=Streptomyces sp. NPDC058330 TaxID=3346449 RepID=UPI0036E03471
MTEQAEQSDAPPIDDNDVVAMLMRQHGEIRNLFDEVETTTGEGRKDAFRRLVRMLAVHETAEEEVVHPFARKAFGDAGQVVADRLEEERLAKEKLSALEDMNTEDAAFLPALLELRADVMEHARSEERYEFAHLRRSTDPERLVTMAKAVRAAEAMAPTHPRPGVESGTKNMALGPMAAVMDRTRDAVRKAMGKDGGRG